MHKADRTGLSDPNLRCNVGGSSGSETQTATVAAGSSLTWYADTPVYHQGPVSFYMTKVSKAASADGSTPWFKIYDLGPTFSGGQAKWPMAKTYNVKVPACLAAGEYLMRIQQLGIHNPGGAPQFYISKFPCRTKVEADCTGCAQLKVTGGGGKTPSPTVRIPGVFKATDPGYKANIYNNFKNYTIPGGQVARC
jgi:hypothetical protein